ncbi:xylose isomerase-like protein [Rhodocollybia butyracea]|uniref:Xylose isomerase-like protein n=1 Tax=Rhodocollybia butyracea TaxID=206335 RepID=A0A9P5Q716_9AGAR|nr:xylose isomerase-like protein [Rhodocollybia butyracea]
MPVIKSAISSLSLGRAEVGHSLPTKLRSARAAGFHGVEISFFCLSEFSKLFGITLKEAARQTRVLLDELDLEAVSLSPLMNFEGQIDRAAHAERLNEGKLWLELCHLLRAPFLQIPGTMLPLDKLSDDLIITDLAEFAELASKFEPSIQIAFEFTSWSTKVNTWQQTLEIVRKLQISNVSICLDTFHMGTYLLHKHSQQIPLPPGLSTRDESVTDSLAKLSNSQLDPHCFPLYQLTDAGPILASLPPRQPTQDPQAPLLQTMSRTNRPFASPDGLLPIIEISKALWALQSKAPADSVFWWSIETFMARAWYEDASVPEELAKQARESWNYVALEVGLPLEFCIRPGV